MRTFFLLSTLALMTFTGCTKINSDTFLDWQKQHTTHLNDARTKLDSAKTGLLSEKKPTTQSTRAVGLIGGAVGDIDKAQGVVDVAVDAAIDQSNQKEKIEKSWWSPRQQATFRFVGAIVFSSIVIVVLVLLLVRFGGMFGVFAALPLIGGLIGRQRWLNPKK